MRFGGGRWVRVGPRGGVCRVRLGTSRPGRFTKPGVELPGGLKNVSFGQDAVVTMNPKLGCPNLHCSLESHAGEDGGLFRVPVHRTCVRASPWLLCPGIGHLARPREDLLRLRIPVVPRSLVLEGPFGRLFPYPRLAHLKARREGFVLGVQLGLEVPEIKFDADHAPILRVPVLFAEDLLESGHPMTSLTKPI